MANLRIRDLVATTAAAITDPTVVQFAVDKTDIPGTRKLALSELQLLHNVNTTGTATSLSSAPAKDDQIWITRGYNTEGDGGGNVYRYQGDSVATVDGGFVINGPGGVGRYLAINTDVANVLQFGAVGDGATDDTAKIQAAINSAGDGGTVFLPKKQFAIATTLVINKGVTFQGVGRGHEGASTVGSTLKWTGAINSAMLRINDGTSGLSVHGWAIRDVGFNGNSVAGSVGLRIGAGNDGTPRAAVGSVHSCWFVNCLAQGIDCWTYQIGTVSQCQFSGCGDGIKFTAGTNYSNTNLLISQCRAANCTIGFHLRRAQGVCFVVCTGEQCQDQGFYLETGGTNEGVNNINFVSCWTEASLQSGGTGRGYFQTASSNASIRCAPITLINCEFGLPSAGNFNMVIDGAAIDIIDPALTNNQGIKITSSSGHTYMQLRTRHDPTTYVTYVAGSGYVSAVIDHMVTTGNALERHQYVMDNSAPEEWESRTKNWFRLRNTSADGTNKIMRIGGGHHTNSELPLTAIVTTSTSGSGIVNVGGGSAAGNAATTVDIYAAANNTTTTGTKIASFVPGGLTLSDGMNIAVNATTGTKIGTGTTQKLGFWNATPVAQQVLATGAGRTVDEVITFLQTIGLCKQA